MEARAAPLGVKLLIATISLLLFFALLEVGMRITGYYIHTLADLSKGTEEDESAAENAVPVEGGPEGTRILCVGDSFTYGGRVERDETYPAQLRERLTETCPGNRFDVINRGICGTNTMKLLHYLPGWLEEFHPHVVILLDGAANRFNPWDHSLYARADALSSLKSRFFDLRVVKLFRILWLNGVARFYGWVITYPDFLPRSRSRSSEAFEEDPFHRTAEAYMERFRFDKAIETSLKAIRANPFDHLNYYRISKIYNLQSHYDAVVIFRELEEVREEHPELMEMKWFAGYVRIFSDKRKWEDGINRWMKDDLGKMVALCKEHGARLIIQNYPTGCLMANSILKSIADEHALPLVNNLAVFDTLEPKEKYLLDDSHCTKDGYRVMAGSVFQVLLAENELGACGPLQ
ncbi:GDSL-type esterase/lipase family protein [Thermodesulfobacteriota bacterium]